ncbi:hypothetical protein Tco_0196779, partial [Tanacetum coccineum]
MDPNTSIGRLCLGVDDQVSLNDRFESEGQWDGSEFHDTANSEYEKNMISNEFAIKLLLDYEEKDGEKVVKKELLVALKGELYFVNKFIINPEEDDVEPGVVLGRSFLRLAKGIVDFGNGIITIYPDLVSFNDDSNDDCEAILDSVDVSDLPQLDVINYSDEGPSLTVKKPLTQEELSREDIEKDIYERILILEDPRPIIKTLKFSYQHKKLLDSVLLFKLKLDGKLNLKKKQPLKKLLGVMICNGYIKKDKNKAKMDKSEHEIGRVQEIEAEG